jgi:hypothetical protein
MLRKAEIDQAARYLMAKSGDCAEGRAQLRAQGFAREGNDEAALIWQVIAGRIKAIRSSPAADMHHQAAGVEPCRFTVIEGGRSSVASSGRHFSCD